MEKKLNRKIIYLAGFLFSLPLALTSYINSSFLELYINEYYVSIVYAFSSILSIWGFFEIPRVLTRLGNRITTLILCLVVFFSLLTLALGKTAVIIIPAFIVFFVFNGLILATLDIFIEDLSKHTSIGKFRGLYLTVINLGWVISQLVSGSIISQSSYSGIYLLSAGLMLIEAGLFVFFLHKFTDPKYKKVSIGKTISFFWHNKHASLIYLLNLILKFFFAWMIIYTPIYLHQHLALSWEQIGLIFTFMLLPFVVLSFPLGKLSDKIGEKKILRLGFLISALFTILIPLITTPKIWVLAIVLFGTRVGAAAIEVMSESYFFKIVNEENADAISFFRNTTPISFLIAPLIAVAVLYFVPEFKFIFFVLGGIMLAGYLIAGKLEDVK